MAVRVSVCGYFRSAASAEAIRLLCRMTSMAAYMVSVPALGQVQRKRERSACPRPV